MPTRPNQCNTSRQLGNQERRSNGCFFTERKLPMYQPQQAICNQNYGIAKYSARGRPFDPNLDLTRNRYPNQRFYSPPSSMGRPLNVSMEVARDNQITLGRARTLQKMSSQFESRACRYDGSKFADSMAEVSGVSKSNISGLSRSDVVRSEDEIVPCEQRISKPKSVRARSCPPPLTSYDKSSSYVSQTSGFPRSIDAPSSGNFTTDLPSQYNWLQGRRTANNTDVGSPHDTYMTLPTQSRQMVPPDSFLRDTAQPNMTLGRDITRHKDQVPIVDLVSQTRMQTTNPSTNSPFTPVGQCYQENSSLYQVPSTFQKSLSTTAELTFDNPKSESTRCKDSVYLKGPSYRDTGVIPQEISPHQMLQVTQVADKLQSEETFNERLQSQACDGTRRRLLDQCNNRHHTYPAIKANVSRSTIECSNARKCGRVQFDGDKNEVRDPQRAELLKHQLEYLVKDTYCPGIIQDTLDGGDSFNNISFSISMKYAMPNVTDICGMPSIDEPMTLLEAFSVRIEEDRSGASKGMPDDASKNMIEETIEKYFSIQNPSDLNSSIKSLLLSETFAEHDQDEKEKSSSFTIDLQTNTIPSIDPEVMFVGYIGRTKPYVEIPEQ